MDFSAYVIARVRLDRPGEELNRLLELAGAERLVSLTFQLLGAGGGHFRVWFSRKNWFNVE